MKKFIITLIAIMFFAISISAADIIGDVKDTDIVALIDDAQIKSYNYKGHTYVIAEELKHFGFDVVWNERDRALKITRGGNNFSPYTPDNENPAKQVYQTDIKAYINDNEITAYNVGGRTIINIESLEAFGNCFYDNSTRTIKIDTESEYRYLNDSGELYLIRKTQYTEDLSFEGILFVRGEKVYEGTIYYIPVHGVERVLQIYYAKDYNDENGLIYYADSNCDDVYYEGQVVNGLPNGQGTAYYEKRQYSPDEPYYYYYTLDDMTNAPTMKNRVMWSGNFFDGEFHGVGIAYTREYGLPMYYGTWVNGVKNGRFYIYAIATADYDGTRAVYLQIDSYYVNGILHGKTTEYSPKGNIFVSGLYKSFDGEYVNGSRAIGKSYTTYHDAEKNENIVYMNCTYSYDEKTDEITEVYYDKNGGIIDD